jgi:hypothetical protein
MPPLPTLPTFEPLDVEPLGGEDLDHVRQRLSEECKCPICLSVLVAPHALTCSHSFCGPCIITALARLNICPICRERPGKPVYERSLDNVLNAIVQPGLNEADMLERMARKREWQTMQVQAAHAARVAEVARGNPAANPFNGGAAGGAGGVRTAMERVPYLELHRMLRQSTEQLQAEMRTLQQRFVAAASRAAPGAPGARRVGMATAAEASAAAAAADAAAIASLDADLMVLPAAAVLAVLAVRRCRRGSCHGCGEPRR